MGEELRTHLGRYHRTVKYASCSAWGLLYRVLEENGLPVGTVVFSETGKPAFADSELCFSISHTKGLCAVAVSDRPVGVDIELIRSDYSPRLVEKSLTQREKENFDGDFTLLWCRKEATAKRTGSGITGYPNNIETAGLRFTEQKIEEEGRQYWLVSAT